MGNWCLVLLGVFEEMCGMYFRMILLRDGEVGVVIYLFLFVFVEDYF